MYQGLTYTYVFVLSHHAIDVMVRLRLGEESKTVDIRQNVWPVCYSVCFYFLHVLLFCILNIRFLSAGSAVSVPKESCDFLQRCSQTPHLFWDSC